MSKLIDAENLLKTIDECELTFDGGVDINELNEIINKQPTVPQWIPCSERLPEECSDVLVTDGWLVNEAFYVNGKFGCFTHAINKNHLLGTELADIIAWQPLPEPYKEATT